MARHGHVYAGAQADARNVRKRAKNEDLTVYNTEDAQSIIEKHIIYFYYRFFHIKISFF